MAAVAAQQEDIEELQPKTVKTLTLLSLKRTYDLFAANHAQKVPLDEERYGLVMALIFCRAATTLNSTHCHQHTQPTHQDCMQGRLCVWLVAAACRAWHTVVRCTPSYRCWTSMRASKTVQCRSLHSHVSIAMISCYKQPPWQRMQWKRRHEA